MSFRKSILVLAVVLKGVSINLFSQTIQYYLSDESEQHEGTWLQWPHQYEYGTAFRNENDATWVAMTNALQANEMVHIIAYNTTEQTRITNLLTAANVPLTNVNFKVFQTNDVWVRDNGPIYARNAAGNLVIEDWGFNGWGGDYNFAKDNPIPTSIATATATTLVNLNSTLTIEGGAYEMDGGGVLLATKTSILSQANPSSPAGIYSIRNPGKTQAQVETLLTQNLGASKFIWLDGWFSTDDITDAHIDGFAMFAPGNKLVTMNQTDLLYWGLPQLDINILYAATNVSNVAYTKVYLPLTQNNVSKTNGSSLAYKGSYVNYYVANNRVLVPNYNDPNDAIANSIIAGLYPGRMVVGIDCRNLYANGGMIHCVTQEQPMASTVADFIAPSVPLNLNALNTTSSTTNLSWTASTDNVGVTGYDVYQGTTLKATVATNVYTVTGLLPSTAYSFTVKAKDAAGNISGSSNSVNIITLAAPLTYCTSKGNDASGEVIQNFVFASINKTSTATIGYENFTTTSTIITRGSSYTFTITPQWFFGNYAEGYAVFIDYNKDGDFIDVGETVWTHTATIAANVTGSVTIPTNAFLGDTRMRVSMKYNGIPSSCETFSFGQVEDYTLNISAGVPVLNLKLLISGFYKGNGQMQPVLQTNYPQTYSATVSDSIKVELHDALQPHGLVASSTVLLNTNGNSTVVLPAFTINNSYYIAIRHRNALETWSASPVLITLSTIYDFSTSPSKAYGNNMTQTDDLAAWAFYSGDISSSITGVGNQDGVIESQDYADMENAVNFTLIGYNFEDITGDGVVESEDYSIIENLVYYTKFSMHP